MQSTATQPLLPRPWSESEGEVLRALHTTQEHGLSEGEVLHRQQKYGTNRLTQAKPRSVWKLVLDQFSNLIAALLVVAAGVAFAFDERVEGFAIIVVIFINAAIGFFTERRAVRAMEALRELGHTETTVRRDSRARRVPATELVPGDIVLIEAGDILTADVRVLISSRLQLDESALTGESVPVEKDSKAAPADASLSDRSCMLFKGTAVTNGSADAVVVATGMATEIGLISALVDSAEPHAAPIEGRLNQLARKLVGLTLAIAVCVATAVVLSGRDLFFGVEIGIALAVATIPEGLPIVATVALARGMWRMAAHNALVDQLSAVETLGSTTVILTDKTGTLTENQMTVVELRLGHDIVTLDGDGLGITGQFSINGQQLDPMGRPELAEALRLGVLCNNATLNIGDDEKADTTGDPTEVALLVAGAKAGLFRKELLLEREELVEIAFDSESKRMATLHREGGKIVAAAKGAPETVIEVCRSMRTRDGEENLSVSGRSSWLDAANEMATKGQRVLALATGYPASTDSFEFKDLVLVGLVGMLDPPRKTVRAAIDACQSAGIRVVMVTGDHGATALAVAQAVGLQDEAQVVSDSFLDARSLNGPELRSERESDLLLKSSVIARATPQQKLELIELYQQSGAIVAMTGDGVNDAPALKKADIGVAMGIRGTQVAREAADVVLQDDELRTVVAAVAQGRAIFANIRKFVIYLMSCNVSEVLAIGLATMAQGPLPILPLQILFLNLVTDVFPALALGVCEGSPALMNQPPRDPKEPMLSQRHWRRIFGFGSVIAICVLAALATATHGLERPAAEATSIAFLTLAMAQLWHVFTMRNRESDWLRNEITQNLWIWAAVSLCCALLILAIYFEPLAQVLSLSRPSAMGWGVALGCSIVPFLVGQVWLMSRRRKV